MNTQTLAQAQAFKAINDDALIAVNGGGVGATLSWPNTAGPAGTTLTLDHMFNRGKVTQAAADYWAASHNL